MPIHRGQDKEGTFYQWGSTGKKYYFDPQDKGSKTCALNKAQKQQTAIYSSGWKGDEKMKIIKVAKKDSVKKVNDNSMKQEYFYSGLMTALEETYAIDKYIKSEKDLSVLQSYWDSIKEAQKKLPKLLIAVKNRIAEVKK